MGMTDYDKKKQAFVQKGMPTHVTDHIVLEENYLEIYMQHNWITRRILSRLYLMGFTTAEIKGGSVKDGIFYPLYISFFSDNCPIHGIPLSVLSRSGQFRQKQVIHYIKSHYPSLYVTKPETTKRNGSTR